MWESWNNHEWIVSKGKSWVMAGGLCWILGVIFALIGIITEAIDTTFIIQSMSWYLLSIAVFGSGIINVVAWLGGIYLHGKKSEK